MANPMLQKRKKALNPEWYALLFPSELVVAERHNTISQQRQKSGDSMAANSDSEGEAKGSPRTRRPVPKKATSFFGMTENRLVDELSKVR